MWPFTESRFQRNAEVSLKILSKALGELHGALSLMERRIMASQADITAAVNAVNAKLTKIGNETKALLTKVTDLQAALANAGNVTPELQAAVDALSAQAQVVDDLVVDVPEPTP